MQEDYLIDFIKNELKHKGSIHINEVITIHACDDLVEMQKKLVR